MKKNYIERCLQGRIKDPIRDIDDEIDIWHDSTEDLPPLDEYLGMTKEEYRAWVKDPTCINTIISKRKRAIPL